MILLCHFIVILITVIKLGFSLFCVSFNHAETNKPILMKCCTKMVNIHWSGVVLFPFPYIYPVHDFRPCIK